ncbi:MAG: DUF1190 domain-containing protein [Motiliproteus sp.]
MKRSQFIDLDRMRKQPTFELSKLAVLVGGTMALTGCGQDKTQAEIYKTLDACKQDNPEHADVCETAYKNALESAKNTAPRYARNRDCGAEFGQCITGNDERGNSWFMPAMAGFMIAQAMDIGKPNRSCGPGSYVSYNGCRYSQPVYSGYGSLYGGYYGNDGTRYGDIRRGNKPTTVKVSTKSFEPKPTPKIAKTLSRGGFGSKAAAKSSWGGGRSSWGG